jgi:hypothetical protein
MYLCEYIYHHWSGQRPPQRLHQIRQSNPTSEFITRNGKKVPRGVKSKYLAENGGHSVLIRYAKIKDVMNWVYPKKKNKRILHLK